jgi:uncharacterized protein GlcG (DUF336 family)
MSITNQQVDRALQTAREAAEKLGVPVNVAIYDDGANLKAFVRMDGAFLGSADVAMNKARTAALFGFNTEALYDFVKPGGTSPGFDRSNGGLTVFPGGIPIKSSTGQLIGAVGVSGGAVEQDYLVAKTAVDALNISDQGDDK